MVAALPALLIPHLVLQGIPRTNDITFHVVDYQLNKNAVKVVLDFDKDYGQPIAQAQPQLKEVRKTACEATGMVFDDSGCNPPPPPPDPVYIAPAQAVYPSISGSCTDWMAQAGITDPSAYRLILNESGCNPNSVNTSSGACGIGQQLPCGKWAHRWNDPVGSLIDMQNYVYAVYGSWGNALYKWNSRNPHWY